MKLHISFAYTSYIAISASSKYNIKLSYRIFDDIRYTHVHVHYSEKRRRKKLNEKKEEENGELRSAKNELKSYREYVCSVHLFFFTV